MMRNTRALVEPRSFPGGIKWANIHSAAGPQFEPPSAEQIVIGSAHRVGVNLVAARQRAHAWELMTGREVTQYA